MNKPCEHCGVDTDEVSMAVSFIAEALWALSCVMATDSDVDVKAIGSLMWCLHKYAQASVDAEIEEHRKAREGGDDA